MEKARGGGGEGGGGGCASFSFLPSMLCKQAGALCRDKLKARAGYR